MPHLLGGYAPYISSATVVTYPSAPPRSNPVAEDIWVNILLLGVVYPIHSGYRVFSYNYIYSYRPKVRDIITNNGLEKHSEGYNCNQ